MIQLSDFPYLSSFQPLDIKLITTLKPNPLLFCLFHGCKLKPPTKTLHKAHINTKIPKSMTSMSNSLSITAKSRHINLPRSLAVKRPSISTLRHYPLQLRLPSLSARISLPKEGIYRVSFRVGAIRASSAGRINVPSTLKPGSVVESDKLPADVRNWSMGAIDAFGGRVTIGDVASKAGVKLNEAQRALQALAADADGFLEVSDEGDVLYVFPKDYRSKLAAKSLRMKIEPWAEKAKSAAEYLIRVSFGTTLVASIILVFTAIIAIMASGGGDGDNRRKRGGRSYDSGISFYFRPRDLFWYWDRDYYRRRPRQQDNEGMNFIESVFSFVFGDGDPNQGIEEKRWKLIGNYIASNGGVVTAEELAPYLDVQMNEEGDESYMLPVLLRFDGQPDVDEEGNILYQFPSLQRTASSTSAGRKEYVGIRKLKSKENVKKFFEEKWRFSKTSLAERAMVIGLGGLNLFGVFILTAMLKDMSRTPTGLISFVAACLPVLQVYAGSFFAIPLIRWFFVAKTNADIEKRNEARKQRARALELPDPSLRRKLLTARDMAQKTVIGKERIIYRTDKDFDDQDHEAREWDKRLKNSERSE